MAVAPLHSALPLAGVLALLLAPMGTAVAANHIVDIQWDAGGQFAHQAEVPPAKFVEVCGKLKPGQKVAWSFKSGAPMNFNIHYHLGKETVYPVKLSQAKDGAQTLPVEVEQVHCWMWSNKTPATASLDVALKIEP
ncbi:MULTISPECIES: hypothetical protein [unclassified Roseateles]|uniref:hypothetical protein n=1 Tax=unclassified Roseateles TaxID=2626991 RepID=UPI0006F41909|nr:MULTISPECIES: hypothetical protein [unclassified Roseateles]KQW51200.1 hypothetical protein ASC81_00660 [Pelomonas sp. Root405]KRA77432.1 hypothetical protein ASD88_00660 [Pelomonas sp. Root662]